MDPNLIITYDPNHTNKSREEVKELLEDAGEIKFFDSEFEGVFLVHVKDPKAIIRNLAQKIEDEPYKFKYTFRWTPVDMWCSTKQEDMIMAVKALNSKIARQESWKMEIGKRGYEGSTMDLLTTLAEHIDKPKIDLKTPQKIVKIEIVGDRAAISLINPNEHLNASRMKA